jgi:hypothetical protein
MAGQKGSKEKKAVNHKTKGAEKTVVLETEIKKTKKRAPSIVANGKKTIKKNPPKVNTSLDKKKAPLIKKINRLEDLGVTASGENKKFEIEDQRNAYKPYFEIKNSPIYELPEEYGETKITLLVQDPYWVHAYWEINPENRKKFGLEKGKHNKNLVIRVYRADTDMYFDVLIYDSAKSWYFQIPESNRPYYSEIGTLESGGIFTAIARSNVILVPTDRAAIPENLNIPKEKAQELFKQSGGYMIHKLVGSQVVSEWISVAGSIFSGVSSHVSSGSGGMSLPQKPEKRGFWADLHTELIVYGSTEPDASVTIGGVPIQLSPDGKFSIRFYLKDGQHSVPFLAKSADGFDTIDITPFVNKRTQRKEYKN